MAVNPYLRFVACLIVLGASFGAGLLIFPTGAPLPVVAQAEVPETPSLSCKLKTWLRLDRDCAARGQPQPEAGSVVADGNATPGAVLAVPASAAVLARPPARAADAELPREALQPTPIGPPERETTAQLPMEQSPKEQPTAQQPTQQPAAQTAQPPAQAQAPAPVPPLAATQPARRRVTVERRAAERRIAAKPEAPEASNEPAPTPAKKRIARREPSAKRSPSEALRAVRKFDDRLQDIPVDAYAADGSRRSIVIRPTSIQDVYYYSVPR
jgi:hypothetical protein